MIFNKKVLLISVLASLVWLLFLSLTVSPFYSLRPDFRDHISNLNAAILFFYRGAEVYTKSPFDLENQVSTEGHADYIKRWDWSDEAAIQIKEREGKEPLLMVWGLVPRPYPPGFILYLSPWAALTEYFGELKPFVVAMMVFSFLLCAHLSFFYLWQSISLISYGFLKYLFAYFAYQEIVGWSLMGQYDAVTLLFLLPAIQALWQNQFWSGLKYYGFASFFHFRTLFYLPLLLTESLLQPKQLLEKLKQQSFKNKMLLSASLSLALLSAEIFLLILPSVQYQSAQLNPVLIAFKSFEINATVIKFIIGFVIISIWAIKMRQFKLATLFIWWSGLCLSMSFARPWYNLFLVPILAIGVTDKTSRQELFLRLIVVLFISGTFFGTSPAEFYLPKRVIEVFFKAP